MPCTVKKTFEAARDTGNVLIAQVKANQPILHQTLEAICDVEPPIDSAERPSSAIGMAARRIAWSRPSVSAVASDPTGMA
jgi:hypothetical protein